MFKLRELIHSRRPAAAAAALLFTALLFYAGARMLPAIADETSWEDSKFGPLDGMEESVYSQTAAAYQDSFLSVARKQQPILGIRPFNTYNDCVFRMLPITPDDFSGDGALEVASYSSSQDIYSATIDSETNSNGQEKAALIRAATAGVRPVSIDIEAYNNIKQNYVVPSDVYMEVSAKYYPISSSGHPHYLKYSYLTEDKQQKTKTLQIMNSSVTKWTSAEDGGAASGFTVAGRPLDCTAADLNGDGYSEFIVAYLTKEASQGETINDGAFRIYVEMYDGKELFDAADGSAVDYKSRAEIAKFDLGEKRKYQYSPCQVRIAKGDFDGDGIIEFPIAFTSRVSFQLSLAKYDRDSNTISEHISNIQFDDLYQHDNTPDQYTTEGMDVTVGDFDGNGSDEIMVVYGTYSGKVKEGKSTNRIAFACYKPDIENASFTKCFVAKDDSVNLWCGENLVAQIWAEAADFDGKDELVYIHPGWVDDEHYGSYVSVREWANLDGAGTLLCNQSTYDMFGWYFLDWGKKYNDGDWNENADYAGSHGMTVGNFKCTNDNNIKQIAIASYGNDNKIDYAVIEAVNDGGSWSFKTHGYQSVLAQYYVSTSQASDLGGGTYTSYGTPSICLTAVDYDHQTMLLGEPSIYTMTAKIQPTFELQMAPRHYDVVNGASIDVFTKQVSMPMYGVYKTQADCTENDEVSSTETKSSETTMGVSVKASAKAGKEGGKVSGSASAGYSYTNTQKESNTQTNKYTATSSVSAAGMYDDFVSYQTEEIDVYRYPIIYPLDDDYGRDGSYAASDDVFGTDGDMTVYPSQRYLQIQVPQQPEQYAVSGLNAEWYDPVHQPYNLFTYPRELKEVKNYSSCVGETTKTNVVIGEANSSSVSVRLSEMTGETDTSSTTNKNSFNAELGVGIGQSNAAGKTPVSVSASFSYDETNSESSSSSSNLTNTAAYTLSWPGQKGYDGVYTQDEMDKASFGAALAMLVENTGNFVMAQMITDIKKTSSSSVWYQNGNYNANPDPALNLSHRLNSSTYTYRTATADDDTPRIMRGVTIYNGQESTGTTLSSSNTSYRALMADDDCTVKVRAYNCSYVDTTDVKAELYWTNEWKDESELTEADKVGTSSLYAIKGWQSTGDSNIKEIAVEWSASKKLSEAKAAADGMLTGYLHVKVIPNGDEIHSDNNWGYVRMALLDPDVYEGTDASSVSSAKLAASKSSSASAQPPVTAEFVKKSAEIITENGQKYIQAKVHSTPPPLKSFGSQLLKLTKFHDF